MLNFGIGEIAIILVLAVVVVGPDRLPEMLRFLGKQYGRVMRASNELRRAFMIEADREDAEKRAEALRKRREQARKRAEEARKRALERAKAAEAEQAPVPPAEPQARLDDKPLTETPAAAEPVGQSAEPATPMASSASEPAGTRPDEPSTAAASVATTTGGEA